MDYFFWGKKTEKRPGYWFGVNSYGSGKGEKWNLSMIHSRAIDRAPLWNFYSKYGNGTPQIVKLLGALAEKPRHLHELSTLVSWDQGYLKGLLENLIEIRIVTAEEPYSPSVPIFDETNSPKIKDVCGRTSEKIAKDIADNLELLRKLVEKSGFSYCPFGDILCMIFHEGYDYAADKLIQEDVIPAFPAKATAEWGMWLWQQ